MLIFITVASRPTAKICV